MSTLQIATDSARRQSPQSPERPSHRRPGEVSGGVFNSEAGNRDAIDARSRLIVQIANVAM